MSGILTPLRETFRQMDAAVAAVTGTPRPAPTTAREAWERPRDILDIAFLGRTPTYEALVAVLALSYDAEKMPPELFTEFVAEAVEWYLERAETLR